MRAQVIAASFIAVICAGFAGSANAQTLAVKVGVNDSNMSQDVMFLPDDELAPGSGFMAGLQMRRVVNRVFELQIEALFTQKGNALRNDAADLHNTIVITYFEVPVLARVGVMKRGRSALSLHGGPAFALNAGTKETNNDHLVERPLRLKAFDMGIALGGQVEWRRLIIGARYTWGLSNIFADDPALFGFSSLRNRVLTISAGYELR